MKNEIYYISGKITDESREQEIKNLERFNLKADELRKKGIEVFNPADLEVEGGATWEWYLARDLKWIYENKPTLYLLSNWKESKGARLEVEFAKILGLRITTE